MNSDKTRTLWLCGLLHGCTHVYHVALVPLYFLIQADFQLDTVAGAPLLVTVMGLAYFLPSYWVGTLADRLNRKKLLAFGLAINGAGFVGLAHAPTYPWALACVGIAGFGGSFYHPAATALIARLFPIGTGKALGLVGIGASTGFFIGPIYAGWRAVSAGSWRAPVLELGFFGILAAVLFALLAREETAPAAPPTIERAMPNLKLFATPILWLFLFAASFAFSLRDFAGSGMGTLGSLFLQQAHGFTPKSTGLALSVIFLASAISNPLFGGLSDRGRLRWTTFVLVTAAMLVFLFPLMPSSLLIPILAVYGFFFMASYPMVEAALMEAVPDAVRGRVFGFFITVAGLFGNLSHWIMGVWVGRLGPAAETPSGFFPLYTLLALLILISLLGLPCLHALRQKEKQPTPSPS
jgi:MFS transporter, FSR family, fosmidomycin resistance protein